MSFLDKVRNLFSNTHSPNNRLNKEEKALRKEIRKELVKEGAESALASVIVSLLQRYASTATPEALSVIKDRCEQHRRSEISHSELMFLVAGAIHDEALRLYDEELAAKGIDWLGNIQA